MIENKDQYRYFWGYHKGEELHACVSPSLTPGDYNLTVTGRGLHGQRYIDFSKSYTSMKGALKGLKNHYPETEWREH